MAGSARATEGEEKQPAQVVEAAEHAPWRLGRKCTHTRIRGGSAVWGGVVGWVGRGSSGVGWVWEGTAAQTDVGGDSSPSYNNTLLALLSYRHRLSDIMSEMMMQRWRSAQASITHLSLPEAGGAREAQ